MKFYAYCIRKDLSDRNGGSLVLWHHGHALEELGHEFGGMLGLDELVPGDADYIMFQSEWWSTVKHNLRYTDAKRICWIGHFRPHIKYDIAPITDIDADYYHTQWKGQCYEYAKKIVESKGKKLFYLPHAGCAKCNTEGEKIETTKTLFIGADYPERSFDWIDYAKVPRITCPVEDAKNYYKSALVCPNLHGDFQKNIVTDFTQEPGMMINDRIFNIILAGGFTISDNEPIVKEFFTEDEVPYANTKADYRSMINHFVMYPEERGSYMKKAKERILKEHLYTHRWKEFLPTIGG